MNYTYHYQKLTERGKNRIRQVNEYFEKHHIIPKCLGGSNDKSNLTMLTAREHYISHWLLCKIHNNSSISIRMKLSSAFNMMCKENTHKRHFNSRQYEIARKNYSKNHPMKDPEIRRKVSETHKKRREAYLLLNPIILPLCKCGCGNLTNHSYAKYLPNHWSTKKGFTDNIRNNLSNKKKTYINKLSKEEKQKYLLRSCHNPNIDHIARGKNISIGKKGKKTNQIEIMGKKFAIMSDLEFQEYLNSKSFRVHKRMTNYRLRYL